MHDSNTAATAERKTSDSPSVVSSTAPSKRVILTMGGKGGVGKTSFMLVLSEWFQSHEIPVTLLDLDTENKARAQAKRQKRVPAENSLRKPGKGPPGCSKS